MKKSALTFMLVTALLGSLLTACSGKTGSNNAASATIEASATTEASPSESAPASPSSEAGESPETSGSPESNPSAEASTAPESPMPSKEPSKEPAPSKKPEKPSQEPAPSAKPAPDKKPAPPKEPAPSEDPAPSTGDIVSTMLDQVEQPALMEMSADQVADSYGIDTKLLDDFTVKSPLMNVKTNEIAVFKVKKAKDVETVKKGIKTRAEAVQKSFEHYLPDQYENAKNYKIVVKDNYVLFLISESSEDLEKAFNAAFNPK